MMRLAPATISGMLTPRPNTRSARLPSAAAATAMTLSRLMTTSANRDQLHRVPQLSDGRVWSPALWLGISSLTAIHNNAAPPAIFT